MKLEPFLKSLNVSPDPEYRGFCARLLERYNPEALSEGRIEKGLTSYTINKGDAIVLCLRSRDDRETLFDENLLMYLLQKAEAAALFQPVQGDINYCGLNLRGGLNLAGDVFKNIGKKWTTASVQQGGASLLASEEKLCLAYFQLKLQDPSSWVAFDHSTELEGFRASVLVDPSSGPPIFCEKFLNCDYKNKPALLGAIFAYGNLVPADNGLTQVGKSKICLEIAIRFAFLSRMSLGSLHMTLNPMSSDPWMSLWSVVDSSSCIALNISSGLKM
ncbi:hypothetical protein BJ741DRAFT_672435 [Chytriomyces cf. hyalinus JEL632]|nr:hypothetical protein BJ741DRAFT_672435 [Chytriomyces cf. hyalinus JEL632]